MKSKKYKNKDVEFTRKTLQIYLENNQIQTRPIFSGNVLRHPAFSNLVNKVNKLNSFKNSEHPQNAHFQKLIKLIQKFSTK